MKSKIELLDTTLRDGAQAVGISFSDCDKSCILSLLDSIGINLIESGVSNPKDREFLSNTKNAKLVSFGATCRKDFVPAQDEGLNSLVNAETSTVCIFGKSCAEQARRVLGVSAERNLQIIRQSVEYLKSKGKRVIFDAEHFFDAYFQDRHYALSALRAAFESGADTLVLCDTNGGTLPQRVYDATKETVCEFANSPHSPVIGIHAHNDCAMAVACTLAAVDAGARHVQGTFLGFGERCGNANLSSVIANLHFKTEFETDCDVKNLTAAARKIAEICNVKLPEDMPYVGAAAFAHKAGMHVDAVLKDERSFEHIPPSQVGNEHRLILSEVSGKSAVSEKLQSLFPHIERQHPKTKEILNEIKNLEKDGFQFDTADASFALLAERILEVYQPSFKLVRYSIHASQPDGTSTAEVCIDVDGVVTSVTENGNGPVNALDKALRGALIKHYPQIADMCLEDYKVRVVDFAAATGAMVRVLITSSDGKDSWTTVGVSRDIIEASWFALRDSFEYKLTGRRKFL